MAFRAKSNLASAILDCRVEESPENQPEKKLTDGELQEKIASALERIDPEQAALLVSRYWQRRTPQEIAQEGAGEAGEIMESEADALRALRGQPGRSLKPH